MTDDPVSTQSPDKEERRNFSFFFAGTVASSAGSSLVDSVWPLIAYWLTESPLVTGLTVFAQVAPQVFFALVAGATVDRAPSKRSFLILPNLISASAFVIATVFGAESLTALVIALTCYFVSESAAIFYGSAIPAVFPNLVGRARIASARAQISVVIQILDFFSPAIAVFLLNHLGARPLFAINAVSFVIAAILLSLIRLEPVAKESENLDELRPKITSDIAMGARYLWNNGPIRVLTLVGIFNAFCGGVVFALYLNLADLRYSLPAGDPRAAYCLYAMVVGGIIGSLLLPRLRRARISPITVAAGALFLTAMSTFALALGTSIFILCVGLLCWQAGYGLVIINATVLRMEIVEDAFLSRVSATARLVSWSASPVGAILAGALVTANTISSVQVFAFISVIPFAAGLSLLLFLKRDLIPPMQPNV